MGDNNLRLRKSVARSRASSSSSCSTSSFSSDDENDDKTLKAIKDYMSNKRELARQLFRSVKTDKIRMMLPQTLKKTDINELEEWCASELCGMSRSRILSILNGAPMVHSSDTSESDDSGPSLEIISDTEAWGTDNELQVKQEGQSSSSKSIKTKSKKKKKSKLNSAESKAEKSKPSTAVKASNKIDSIKVKKEEAKDPIKPQEGESLLDLLELEMRARAIRALIRKEEDIVPSSEPEQKNTSNVNALKQTVNSIASSGLLHESNINGKAINIPTTRDSDKSRQRDGVAPNMRLVNIGEDEDLVLVVKPTPTISLLSSEGDSDDSSKGTNKKSLERKTERLENNVLTTDERRVHVREKSSIEPGTLEIVITNQAAETNRENSVTSEKQVTVIESNKSKEIVDKTPHSSNIDNTESLDEPADDKIRLPKKIKRKRYLKEKIEISTAFQLNPPSPAEKSEESFPSTSYESNKHEVKQKTDVAKIVLDKLVVNNASTKVVESEKHIAKELTPSNDNDVVDYEEIIDLDDYPDDMDDIENDDNHLSRRDKSVDKSNSMSNNGVEDLEKISLTCAETWATRYYQTDSVQNVIKESKIQSEIRKRLRERQKLSKLNNHLKSDSTSSANEKTTELIAPKPTGSVKEYLALKGNSDTTSDPVLNEKPSVVQDNDDSTTSDERERIPSPNSSPVKQIPPVAEDKTDQIIRDIKIPPEEDKSIPSVPLETAQVTNIATP